ncbi:MAG: hypothetical protein ABIH41_01970 [Nanoarchaeota archaeon]
MRVERNHVYMDKVLNKLDLFVCDFIDILEKHTKYVIVSGYVSILFGRSRSSEDVDILVEPLDESAFARLHSALLERFHALNSDDRHELFALLSSRHAIRYAYKDKVIPNMEVKFMRSPIDKATMDAPILVHLNEKILFVGPLELQILFKELVLKSDKDLEDALHLREVFKDSLSEESFKKYKALVERYG